MIGDVNLPIHDLDDEAGLPLVTTLISGSLGVPYAESVKGSKVALSLIEKVGIENSTPLGDVIDGELC